LDNFNYVVIEEREPHNRLNKLSPMTINGDGVAFFSEALEQTCSIEQSADGRYIQAVFFQGSDYETCLIAVMTVSAPSTFSSRQVSRGVFIEGKLNEQSRATASEFLRNTGTLEQGDSQATSRDGALFVDSGGFAYIGKSNDQFMRITLIAMLCSAYMRTLQKQVLALSEAARNDHQSPRAIELYEDMLRFNAGFYQRLPIKLDRHELSKVWDALARHHRISDHRDELDLQLSALAQWVRRKQEKLAETQRHEQAAADAKAADVARQKEETREKRFQRYVALVSVVLALMSVVLAAVALPEYMISALVRLVTGR
jgi:hypothetical protein